MDPSTGRFTTMDSYLGRIQDPTSLHKYLYAHSNPVNYTDPSGYFSLPDIMTALSIKFTSGTYQVYALYQSLGTTAVGRVLIEVGQEGLELIIAGDLTIEGVGYSLVEVVIGVAFNDETDLSGIKKSANIVGKSKRPGGYRTGDIDKHGLLSPGTNRAVGYANKKVDKQVQSHHPIQNEWAKKWAKKNNKKYNEKEAMAILLESNSGLSHAKISAAQRARRRTEGFNTSIQYEFNTSYREMINAGVDESQAKKAIKKAYKYFDGIGGFK